MYIFKRVRVLVFFFLSKKCPETCVRVDSKDWQMLLEDGSDSQTNISLDLTS